MRHSLADLVPERVASRLQRYVPGAHELRDLVAEARLEAVQTEQRVFRSQPVARWNGHEVVLLDAAAAQPAHDLTLQQMRSHEAGMLLEASSVLVPGLSPQERGEHAGEHRALPARQEELALAGRLVQPPVAREVRLAAQG